MIAGTRIRERHLELARAWGLGAPVQATGELRRRTAARLAAADRADVWLALAVLGGRLPKPDEVVEWARFIEERGATAFVARIERRATLRGLRDDVEVVTDQLVVDVEHTAKTKLATGIQRVVRKTLEAGERSGRHDGLLVGWDRNMTTLRLLSDEERDNAIHGGREISDVKGPKTVVVPWRCDFALLELAIEEPRTDRIAALAEFSGNRTGVIGFDCVPITSGETVGVGMGAAFARNLCAVAHFDRVAAISEAAAREYDGWRGMLAGTGLTGPEIRPIPLATEAPEDEGVGTDEAMEVLGSDDLPLVLVVGSHEPRKNHLAILFAAERLWRDGAEFCLTFVGGNSWNSEGFSESIAELEREGRPVKSVRGISDGVLAAGYRNARAVLFPSLNEGFGLPVVESIASGTPVLTSRFGSMAEIGAGRGALLVDPRDDDDLVRGLREIIDDEAVRARLHEELGRFEARSWVQYADDLWGFLFPERVGDAPMMPEDSRE
jgi:glycosyltransferase involved in cell wall biosynthesis